VHQQNGIQDPNAENSRVDVISNKKKTERKTKQQQEQRRRSSIEPLSHQPYQSSHRVKTKSTELASVLVF